MLVTLHHYLVLSILLFAIGAIGAVVRRNVLVVFMSIELMMGAASLAILSFARWNLLPDGKVLVLIVIAVAAAEAAVGLAIVVSLFRLRKTVMVDEMRLLRG